LQRWLSFLCASILIVAAGRCAAAFEAEDMIFGYGAFGWQAGLGLSQESIKPLGFFGYEKTGLVGFLSHDANEDQLSSWIGGHKKVYVGNISYSLEFFVANIQRPVLSTFLKNVDPHIGAYGEYSRKYGEYGHGLSLKAQMFVSDAGKLKYSISPYMELSKGGTWRLSASLGSLFGVGIFYLEPSENIKLDATFTLDNKFSVHALMTVPDQPLSIGAGWTDHQIQGFIRYFF